MLLFHELGHLPKHVILERFQLGTENVGVTIDSAMDRRTRREVR